MGKCGYCGSAVLFGGVREGTLRFCNARCRACGAALLAALGAQALAATRVKRAA